MQLSSLLLAYIGPDTMMPVTSLVAASFGVILIFWNYVTRAMKLLMRLFRWSRNNNLHVSTIDPGSSQTTTNP